MNTKTSVLCCGCILTIASYAHSLTRELPSEHMPYISWSGSEHQNTESRVSQCRQAGAKFTVW